VTIVERLVPEGLWELFQRVAPMPPRRPQGGGRRRYGDREVLAAIVFVVTTGCTWRQLPPVFGVSWQTVHRRFATWTAAGMWTALDRATPDELDARGEADHWSRHVIDSLNARATRMRPASPRQTPPNATAS
jgi:transposase